MHWRKPWRPLKMPRNESEWNWPEPILDWGNMEFVWPEIILDWEGIKIDW
jgi:hypothetical protein